MFALPHHQSSFSGTTKANVTDVKLDTPTKGVAALVVADEWTMVEEELPVSVGFLPWSPQAGTVGTLSDTAKAFIHNITMQELSQNVILQSNQDSMYFSGKVSTVRAKEARRVSASH
jgi:endo-1,3(4)-beta-glucanase